LSKLPPYVPPHLTGKVSDFQQEQDGRISFAHPENSLGLGPEESRQTMSQEQYKQTFDRDYRSRNFDASMRGQYAPLDRRPSNRSDQLTSWIADKLNSGISWGTSSRGKSVATAGLLSALAGGATGAYLGHRGGGVSVSKSLMAALLAGAAGAGATAYGQNQMDRRSAYMAKQASDVDFIVRAITMDPYMSPAERAACLRAAALMSSIQRDELARMLSTATGAGVGAIVLRFMRGKGLIPTMVGGILGAVAGYVAGPGPKYNPMGQLSLSNYR
jgi:hypothetical protein